MPAAATTPPPYVARIRHLLRPALRAAAASGAGAIRRAEVPLPTGPSPLRWLAGQPGEAPRFYWRSRGGDLELGAAGALDVVTIRPDGDHGDLVAAAGQRLAALPDGCRLYGGMRFDTRMPGDADWAPMGAGRFLLPRFEWIADAQGVRLACNFRAEEDLEPLCVAVDGGSPGTAAAHPGAMLARQDEPDRTRWTRIVEAALAEMAAGPLQKVVLARRTALRFAVLPDPIHLLEHLQTVTRDCFHFLFAPGPSGAFLGASPERFYRRAGRRVETEAVAGTRPRGATREEDARLAAGLLASGKDGREHAFVRDMLRAELAPLCGELSVAERPELMRLTNGQHLFSAAQGTLRAEVTDADLFRRLHPTPAVGGSPTAAALDAIRAAEGFDRGWYAAPLGWLGRDAAEFTVAIRSARLCGAELALFAGAGIVPGSHPDEEWDEIENKIRDFGRILAEAP